MEIASFITIVVIVLIGLSVLFAIKAISTFFVYYNVTLTDEMLRTARSETMMYLLFAIFLLLLAISIKLSF